jgi:hypothetical protein
LKKRFFVSERQPFENLISVTAYIFPKLSRVLERSFQAGGGAGKKVSKQKNNCGFQIS